ncbi:MAG TPA: glucosamine-6-phosphate deaminase [Chitinophagaceae bacterium]|nr:glucosamine-6-phosphate deaminase [Chitinophagaceae bacterium]
MIQERKFDNLIIRIHEERPAMGADAATAVAERINILLSKQDFVNVIFAAAPSQNEFLFFLSKRQDVCWNQVNAFQMDEYVGLNKNARQLFGNFLKEHLFDKLPFNSVYYIDGNASDVELECQRYANLLRQYPPDLSCMGIGVNTHIAFNDPHTANFKDPLQVKIIDLDFVSRRQQVDDGCFENLGEVPSLAITLTIPVLLQANYIYCIVPGINKAEAIYHTLNDEINEKHPSTILRMHPNAVLYLDANSSSKIEE